MQSSFLVHPIPPLYDKDSRILILGSFPSPKSREVRFFYGHPQNRFWKVMARVLDWRGEDSRGLPGSSEGGDPLTAGGPVFVPSTVEEKRIMLLSNHIALWDTIASCEITGASDSSITNVTPNDLSPILETAKIRAVFCNGASDSSITNVTPNDLSPILETAKIRAVFCNGAASHRLYMKYIFPVTGREALKLPSTSPANAAWSVDRLTEAWRPVKEYL